MHSITARRKLGLPLTGTGGGATRSEGSVFKKYGIGYDGQGFNLLREGRELAANASLNLYTKHADYNYMHGDIDFPAIMDGYFGVQSNKSRTSMNSTVRKALEGHLKPFINQIYGDSKEQQKVGASLAKEAPDEPLAESLAKLLKPVLPQPRLTPEEIEKVKSMREEMVRKFTNTAYTHNRTKQRELEQKAAATNDRGEKEQLALEKEMLNERLQHHIDRIEARFAVSSPTRLFYESLHNNDLYKMEDRGDEAHITINKDTVFYTDVYSQIEKVTQMRVLLDMMINTLGYAEFLAIKHGDDMKELYWQRARAEVSFHANTFVKAMPAKPERKGGDA